MNIAGPCSFIHPGEKKYIIETAKELKKLKIIDIFRCKLWLGGTSPLKYVQGIEDKGISTLLEIEDKILPVATEVHDIIQANSCQDLTGVWVGARNSSNYTLIKGLSEFPGYRFIKRGMGQTIEEIMGIYDICKVIHGYIPFIIERGTNYLSRTDKTRWSISLNEVLRVKYERPDIFKHLVVDCSHSVGLKKYIPDVYRAMKEIGVKHYMFEASIDGKSKTDQGHILSVQELKEIIE